MKRRILVLAVDRDDDVGRVGIKTPIVGEEDLLEAAQRFGIERPEDPDLNVIYAAVNTARRLRNDGYDVIVALVSGDPSDQVRADLRIKEQVEDIVKEYSVNGIILVADGREDEEVIPIIQGVAPIVGVRRVVVEQLRGLEETYILIGRYIRKAVMEPRFARVLLGYPGLVVTGFAILALLGLLSYALTALLLLAGILMIVRGFELDEKLIDAIGRNPLMALAALVATVSVAAAAGIVYYTLQTGYSMPGYRVIAEALSSASPLLGVAGLSIIVARMADKLIHGNLDIIDELIGLSLVITVVIMLYQLSSTLSSLTGKPTPTDIAMAVAGSGIMVTALVGIALVTILRVIEGVIRRRTSSPA